MATFRGKPACACLIEWLPVYEKELLRRGVIKYNIDIYQLIGGAKTSAGTHSTGGAFDIGQYSTTALKVASEMGAATWHRGPAQKMIHHAHGVLKGCPHNGPARYQIAALAAGYSGLGYAGRGSKDNGPPPRKLRTWRQGIVWAKAQAEEKDWLSMATENEIIKAVWGATGNIPGPYKTPTFPDGHWDARTLLAKTTQWALAASTDAAATLALTKVLVDRGTSLTAADIEAAVKAGIDAKIDTATVNLTTNE